MQYNDMDNLYHHGIKGQKWGIRRFQKKNGELTAAGKKRYSDENQNGESIKSKHRLKLEEKYRKKGMTQQDAERAADRRIKIEKVIAVTAAVTVAAAATYVASNHIKDRTDGIIKAGTKLQRITANDKEDLDRAFYAAANNKDKVKYAGLYGKQLSGEGAKVYKVDFDVKSDVKVASRKKAVDAFVDLYKNDSEFRETVEKRNSRFYDIPSFANMTDKELKKRGYDAFNKALVDHGSDSNSVAKKFYDRLKSQGYDAIIDVNDKKYSGYNAKKPVIVFGTKDKIVKDTIQEMSAEKIGSHYKKASDMLTKEAIASSAVSVGAQYAGVFGAFKLSTTLANNAAVNNYRIEHPNSKLTDKEIVKLLSEQNRR